MSDGFGDGWAEGHRMGRLEAACVAQRWAQARGLPQEQAVELASWVENADRPADERTPAHDGPVRKGRFVLDVYYDDEQVGWFPVREWVRGMCEDEDACGGQLWTIAASARGIPVTPAEAEEYLELCGDLDLDEDE